MSSQNTIQKALELLDSPLNQKMEEAVKELKEENEKFQSGNKSAGTRARKKTSEWGKAVSERIKQLREIKALFANYRKETVDENKG